ncbi:DUF7824 domain-containing protein [Streptomyces sp. NPDC004838]
MRELLETVRSGKAHEVPVLLKPLTPAERRACLAELRALRAEVRGWGTDRWRERSRTQTALLVSGAGCQTGAAATASWIGARDLRNGRVPHRLLLDVLSGRDAVWLGDVAHRLAARASTVEDDYPLIHELVERSGCPVPTSDGYVSSWARGMSHTGKSGLRRLGEDPHTAVLVPRLFEIPRLPDHVQWHSDPEVPDHWPTVLTELTGTGVLERSTLVDGSVSRLLRGGRPNEMRFFLTLLRRLELSTEEERARVSDWVGMAADGSGAVAAHAQAVLGRLAENGSLPARSLADMSGAVLFRTEKKLVRAQLVLLGKVLRKDPATAPELLPVIADAFGHEDIGVQERALKLVARHLSAVDDGLRDELKASAVLLSPVHREAAVQTFGELPADQPEAYEEVLPAVPRPRRVAPVPDSVAELVEEVVVLLRNREESDAFERVLDGLVRLGHREPEPLAAALREAVAGHWLLSAADERLLDRHLGRNPNGIAVVIAALIDRVSVRTLHDAVARSSSDRCPHQALGGITKARLWEAAFRLRTDPLPFLLAAPTRHTGALEPDVLVERLREYQRLGSVPAPVDFGQALLRVERGGDGPASDAAAAAARLGTREGDRLAAWLTGEAPEIRVLRTGGEPEPEDDGASLVRRGARNTRHRLRDARERVAIQRDFPKSFHWLGRALEAHPHCFHWADWAPDWRAVLPHDREALAAWMLPGLLMAAADGQRGVTRSLVSLAEAESPAGPAGPALHRALAVGLGDRHADDRLAAVDALLVLAARGQLDTARLGHELAELTGHGKVKTNRLAEALRTAAATGAYGTTWSVLAVALPRLLRAGTPTRGLGEILAVAADCVERCGGSAVPAARTAQSAETAQTARTIQATRAAIPHPAADPTDNNPSDSGSTDTGPTDSSPMDTDAPAAGLTDTPPAGGGSTVADGPRPVPGTDGEADCGIPGLAELAGRRGTSQAVAQASRLLTALRRGADAPHPKNGLKTPIAAQI